MKIKNIYLIGFLTVTLALLINPAASVSAFGGAAQSGAVIASAVVSPAQTTRLSFITGGLIKELNAKQGDAVKAGQVLAVLNAPDLEYAVIAAESAYQSAYSKEELQNYESFVTYKHRKKYVTHSIPGEMRIISKAKTLQAQLELDIAKFRLSQMTLTAPYDSIVTSVNIAQGEYVQQGQIIITLANSSEFVIETTDLSERDIAKVKLNSSADIFIAALNKTFSGKVIRVAPISNIVGGDVVYKITLAFDQQPENLLWGMTSEVTFK